MNIRFWALLLILLTLASLAQAQDGGEETGELQPLAGAVMIREDETLGWEPVTDEIHLEDGVEIMTDASGRALLIYGEGLSTEILPNSHIVVDEIEYSDDAHDIEILIEVLVGDTFNTIDEELPEEGVFEVHTPSVLMKTRHAHWYTFTASNGDTLIAAVNGTLETEQFLQQNSIPLTALDGQSVMYMQDGYVGWVLNSLLVGNGTAANVTSDARFDFARELSCLGEGVCNYFCMQQGSAPLCEAVVTAGFLNCAERVHVVPCSEILAERPASILSDREWQDILEVRLTDDAPAERIQANQGGGPGGGNQGPGGNQQPGGGNQGPGGSNQPGAGNTQGPGGGNQQPGGGNQGPGSGGPPQGSGGNAPPDN